MLHTNSISHLPFNNSGGQLPRNPSQTSYGTDISSHSQSENVKNPSIKISQPGHHDLPGNSSSLPLDSNTLADLLKVLDDVREQLQENDFEEGQGNSNLGFESSESPSFPKERSRKFGMFNPDFRYFSQNPGPSLEKHRTTTNSNQMKP